MRYIICFLTIFVFVPNVVAFEKAPPLTDREIVESLVELKVGQDKLNKRIDDMRINIDHRFDSVDQRFDAVDQRFVGIDQRFDAVDQRFVGIDQRFDGIDQRFDDVNNRFGDMNSRFDDLKGLLYVVLAGIFTLVGFVIWDRRTALAPAVKKNRELEEKEEMFEKVLKELAREDAKVEKAMKHAGFM